jgi:hypothetical protein
VTDSKNHSSEESSLHGRVIRPSSPAELIEAVDHAFDYRGDVRIALTSGVEIEGYVSNRGSSRAQPCLALMPKDSDGIIEIFLHDIVSIAFTGEDTASGKSWEAWVAKKESQRKAESDAAAADARARGFL